MRLEPEDIERLASAAYLIGNEADAKTMWMRLHHEFVDRDEFTSAARIGFWLSLNFLISGDIAQANGWLSRSQRLIKDGADCAAHGYGCMVTGLMAMGGGNIDDGNADFARAIALGDRFGDADLLTLGLIGQGQALVESGQFAEGGSRLDEAMVSVTSSDVSPVLAGIAYCAVILTCQQMFDVARAQEWTTTFDAWCASQPDLVPFRGQCLVHRSELLQAKGDWDGALSEVTKAREHLAHRSEAVVGRACYQKGELHRLRGEFAEAESMFRQAGRHACEPQPGMSLLRLSEGRRDAAASAISSAIETIGNAPGAGLPRARLLAAAVEILLADSRSEAARASAEELGDVAARVGKPLLRALSTQAAAMVHFALGETQQVATQLHNALSAWQELGMPYEGARARVLMARVCQASGDRETAKIHFDDARAVFENLGAAPDLAQLDEVDQTQSQPSVAALTDREREVLTLVASGMTNRRIAKELGISEHTVARHLGNIFDKIGVGSRTAASTFAHKHKLV